MAVCKRLTNLWAIRHAETKSNRTGVFMGSLDVPASAESLRIAAGLAATIRSRFIRIYTSPLVRAAETAYAMFPKSAVVLDERLRERSLGMWEGMHKSDVLRNYPEAFTDGHMNAEFTPPGGEDLAGMIERIVDFVGLLSTVDEPAKVLVVTHNGWIRTAQHIFDDIDVASIYVESIPQLKPICIGVRVGCT